jgi:pSer/pThr/pTyr-binding forkhead associated (FHA) protein
MALTLVIKQPADDGQELSVTLDAPRIVIGRAKSCDVRLPDPSVSQRHASIRRQGGRNLIVDEGSTNGTMVGRVKLPPQTPRSVRDGELVRIGRVWLELRFGGVAEPQGARRIQALALDFLRARLAADGEEVDPYVAVTAGPDEGARLMLKEPSRDYVIGRGRDADLQLGDELVSRHHAALSRADGDWRVRDLGSKRGTRLDGAAIGPEGSPWREGQALEIGTTRLVLTTPLTDALDEALSSADVRMRPEEYGEAPPGTTETPSAPVEAPEEVVIAEEHEPSPSPPPGRDSTREEERAGRSFGTIDLLVILVALGLFGLSIAGLWWVLG